MRAIVLLALALALPVSNTLEQDGSCRLLSLLPFSDALRFTPRAGELVPKFSRWTPKTLSMTGFTYTAALLMAMEHFNNRDDSVVPEIATLPQSCTAYFSNDSTVLDGALDSVTSGELLMNTSLVSKPCVVLGPYGILPTLTTASIAAALRIPQILYSTAPYIVTESSLYPTTVRTTALTNEYASKILSYVRHMKRDYLAIVLGGSDYDRALSMFFEQHAIDFNITVVSFKLFPSSPKVDEKLHITTMWEELKKSGIRTIFRTFIGQGPRALEKMAESVQAAGLLEDDYLYILEENMAPVDDLPAIVGALKANSPMDRLLSGAIVVAPVEAWESDSENEFLLSWRSQNETFVDAVNVQIPLAPDQPGYFQAAPDLFQTNDPRRGAAFVYDSVMAAGFGACRAQESLQEGASNGNLPPFWVEDKPSGRRRFLSEDIDFADEGGTGTGPPPLLGDSTPPPGTNFPPSGPSSLLGRTTNPLVAGIVESVFTGALGRVSFSIGRDLYRDRIPEDVSFGAYNVQPVDQLDGKRTYEMMLVTRTVGTEWQTLPERSFVFRDGASVLREESSVMFEERSLPKWT